MFELIILSLSIFIIGAFGMFLSRTHVIIVLISLELLLLACSLNFISFSIFFDDFFGQIVGLLVLAISSSETAIGLSILIIFYRLRGGISIDLISLLKS
jgi:NADH-quinone oxidoreductase subunit K